jgi:hypothetical protein
LSHKIVIAMRRFARALKLQADQTAPSPPQRRSSRQIGVRRSIFFRLRVFQRRCVISSRRRSKTNKGTPPVKPEAEGNAMNSFTAIVSILAAAAAVTFAITAYVN